MKDRIITERLVLDKLTVGDAEFIYNLLNTKEWIENIGNRNIQSAEDAVNYINRVTSNKNFHFWVVKISGLPIGIITFLYKDYLPAPDIGFAFLKEYTGKGYACEAAKSIMQIAKNEHDIKVIYGVTILSNIPSQRVLEKLGLRYSQNITIENEELMLYTWEDAS